MNLPDLLLAFMFSVCGFLAGYLTGIESQDRWWRRELKKFVAESGVAKELKEIAKAKEKAK